MLCAQLLFFVVVVVVSAVTAAAVVVVVILLNVALPRNILFWLIHESWPTFCVFTCKHFFVKQSCSMDV